ncbi:hypothetical protein LAT59_04250 [Candidatus Gracilibacteria bacterium]|nr:hypothetical protein [Candidatus Gracilibacteria bacterium]
MSSFGPRNIKFSEIAINTLGQLIAGFIGSIIILIIVFASAKVLDIGSTMTSTGPSAERSTIFPIILSLITFIGTTASFLLGTKLFQLTDPEKYSRNSLIYSHLTFYGIFVYIFLTPVYLITGAVSYDMLMIITIIHALILALGTSIIQEILSNYRYLLLGVYASFVGTFFASAFVILFFTRFESGYAKLLSLLLILPLIYTSVAFFKGLSELLYAKYYNFTSLDPLGDIHIQLQKQAEEELRELEEKNTL